MKNISALLGLVALLFVELALAAAVATTVNGNVNVQTGSAAPRVLRIGDQVNQGDTVFTGVNSAVVLKFDDGQIAALTANSRMQVTQYQYNAQAQSGSVLLSLVQGGMRAITGLIGRRDPGRVSYRAATATIGIRGTDVTIVTSEGNVVVTVTEGAVNFTFEGKTIVIPAGQGVNARPNMPITLATAQSIIDQLTLQNPRVAELIGGVEGLRNAINDAAARDSASPGTSGTTPTGSTGTTSGGTGSASPS